MAIRGLVQDVLDEVDRERIGFLWLAELQFSDGTVRLWAGPQNEVLTYDSNSWTGSGDLASLTNIAESEKLEDQRIQASLRLSSANLTSIQLDDQEGRQAIFRLVIYDADDATVLGDISVTREMGAVWAESEESEEDGQRVAIVTLNMELIGEATLLRRTYIRRLTHEDTLEMDPNDNFNEFSSDPDMQRGEGQLVTRTSAPGAGHIPGPGSVHRDRVL